MRIYVVYDITKTEIEFLRDPETGTKAVFDFISQLGEQAKTDPTKRQIYELILRGMRFLEHHGLQAAFKTYFQTHLEDGRPYTIMIVKHLTRHVPLLEFRINETSVGAFRVFFFEHVIKDTQILCFARALIETTTTDPAFETMANEVDALYQDFLKQPEQYINLEGEDIHD